MQDGLLALVGDVQAGDGKLTGDVQGQQIGRFPVEVDADQLGGAGFKRMSQGLGEIQPRVQNACVAAQPRRRLAQRGYGGIQRVDGGLDVGVGGEIVEGDGAVADAERL